MIKYYTRACNFYYGKQANSLIKKKIALPLCGNQNIAFDKIEIFKRNKNFTQSKLININKINKLKKKERYQITKDLKKIIAKRKNF